MEGIVLGVSELKQKTAVYGGRAVVSEYRYIRVYDEITHQQVLVRMTENAFQTQPVPIKNGQQVTFDHLDRGTFKLTDGTEMFFNPKIVTIKGTVKEHSIQRYYLWNIQFYDWGVVLQNNNSKCNIPKATWDSQTGLETSSLVWKYKNKVKEDDQKSAFVEVETNFNVYYHWDVNKKWLFFNNGEPVNFVSENLLAIKKIVHDEEEVTRTRLLLEEIKTLLQNKMFVTFDDILALAQKYTMPEQDVQTYVKNAVWKKNYDEAFTDYLKPKAKQVLYGNEGIFYCLPNNITILEDPQPSRASYIFIGDPNFISSNIEAIRRENREGGTYFIRDDISDPLVHYGSTAWRELLYRLKKATPDNFIWFVGRVVHLDTDQWKRDMDMVLTTAQNVSASYIPPTTHDPKAYNTSAVAHLPTTADSNNTLDASTPIDVPTPPFNTSPVSIPDSKSVEGKVVADGEVVSELPTGTYRCQNCHSKVVATIDATTKKEMSITAYAPEGISYNELSPTLFCPNCGIKGDDKLIKEEKTTQ
jgi:hypothetical protein